MRPRDAAGRRPRSVASRARRGAYWQVGEPVSQCGNKVAGPLGAETRVDAAMSLRAFASVSGPPEPGSVVHPADDTAASAAKAT
jgi:hypothetical protein